MTGTQTAAEDRLQPCTAVKPGGQMSDRDAAAVQGSWTSIILVYAIAVLGATTISQAIPVVGDIARLFHAGAQAGWIISSPSALVAIGALLTGAVVDRVGDKPMLIVGSAIIISGDIGVATADSLQWLLAMRVVEGVGYVCISVAAIALMTRITHGARRNIALTLWSSYIPMSFAIPLLLAALLAGTGHWRWAFNGHALALGALALIALLQLPGRTSKPAISSMSGLRTVLRTPVLYLLGLTFACISFVQTGVLSTLPLVLAGKYAVGIGVASSVGTLGMAAKAAGCLIVGPLLNRRIHPVAVAAGGVFLVITAGLALGIALPGFSAAVLVSCLFFFGSGLIVGLWALVPFAAPSRECLGAASGLVTQITLWGVLFGPPAAFAARAAGGWMWEGLSILVGGTIIIVCIICVSRTLELTGFAQRVIGKRAHSAH